jgi:hypothetical protein
MKTHRFLIGMILLLVITACKKDENPTFPEQLNTLKTGLTASFDTLNIDLTASASNLIAMINDSAAIRTEMKSLFSQTSFVVEFSYITPQGIMKIIEPPLFYPTQGADISTQSHIIQGYQTKLPVLSSSFYAVENFWAAVDFHPVVNSGEVLGGVTALFLPEDILGRLIAPLVKNQTYEMWVMEKGGKVLYDQDSEEIGLNVLTDPVYAEFTELIAAAEKINAESTGETTYSFYQTGTTTKVVKKTYWLTFTMYGTEWKLIWVKPE